MMASVVLAGRENKGRLASVSDAPWEALVPVAGRPMGARVVEALRGAEGLTRVVVVGPEEAAGWRAGAAEVKVLAPGSSLVENLVRGVEAALPADELLVATSDVPLLTPEDVGEFARRARALEADLVYPIVRREVCEAAFPGVRRTYVRLRDGTFTGGNLFYLRAERAGALWPFLERAYAARKRPLRLLPLFGVGTIVRVLFGRAGLGFLEARASRLLGLRARALPFERPALAVDVDKPDDLELADRVLLAREKGEGP
ncbi:MAG: nucleotidyltransferase family protein [Clostridia bacterium]|nr:nucleotidyltransferase family protein [Clostridia bacterium]